MPLINTAFSSHKRCFICRVHRVNGEIVQRLVRLKEASIIQAYVEHNLYLKQGIRCCPRHLDETGKIRMEEFERIPSRPLNIDNQTLFFLNSLKKNVVSLSKCQEPIIDQFRDVENVDENTCLFITGWTKEQFMRFSTFIKSTKSSKSRDKNQLIALYRLWLRKKQTQQILATFKTNGTQRQISRYLYQIRKAIHKDFTPKFLGASVATRDFFLRQNTEAVKELHQLQNDELAIVADGTYSRCEKSSNNEFQYSSWSTQKKASLIKPFLITCTSGWIIDCYGPFRANQNDAQIFEKILENDTDLSILLQPRKTIIFIDRAFRDNVSSLIQKGYKVQIPTCRESKARGRKKKNAEEAKNPQIVPLTTNETSVSRLCTKIRYVVEQKIGHVKKAALDRIRNTELGHVAIDFRNSSAMCNFTHNYNSKPSEVNIARRIKKATQTTQINKLEFLLDINGRRLQDNSTFLHKITMNTDKNIQIEEFPSYDMSTLKEKIILSDFQVRLSVSYMKDLENRNTYWLFGEKLIAEIEDSKIRLSLQDGKTKLIFFKVSSRHKRGKKNKKIINQNYNKISSISSDSDMISDSDSNIENQTENREERTPPTFSTEYKVFIHFKPNSEKAKGIKDYICSCLNGRRIAGVCIHIATVIIYLSNKRKNGFRDPAGHLMNIFPSHFNNNASNRPTYIKNIRKNRNEVTNQQRELSCTSSDDDSVYCENSDQDNLSTEFSGSSSDSKRSCIDNSNNSKHTPDSQSNLDNSESETCDETLVSRIQRHMPGWGAYIEYRNQIVHLTNTCTIDYLLFSIYVIKIKLAVDIRDIFPNFEHLNVINRIIGAIHGLNWNSARELWVVEVLKLNQTPIRKTLSLFGSERQWFLDYLKENQMFSLIKNCSINCERNGIVFSGEDYYSLFFEKKDNLILLKYYGQNELHCDLCNNQFRYKVEFKNNPSIIFIESIYERIYYNEIPHEVFFEGNTYSLICTTLFKDNHFTAVFYVDGLTYYSNDLGKIFTYFDHEAELKNNRRKSFVHFQTGTSVYVKQH